MSSSSSLDSCWISDKGDKKEKSKCVEVQRNDTLHSNTSRYRVLDFSGEGSFGKVAKCVNLSTIQTVALKILKWKDSAVTKRETDMLEAVSVLDPVKKNVVRFFEKFEHEGHACLAFEMLDRSLLQLFKERQQKPLSVSEIRPIAQQLLTAFDALKGIGVIHSDLKPDNIMLVNHQDEPFRVKLIDFGVSHTTSEVKRGMKIQPVGYRAPEVVLGLPFSEGIDMWGLGCVLAFLYVGKQPFAVNCEYQMMKNMVEILGQPADHLLFDGKYSMTYFKLFRHFNYAKWWLKTPREYKLATGREPKIWQRSFKCLDDLTTLHQEEESIELHDRRAFVGLLKCLLDMDPERRITPGEALTHQYVSMAHLVDELDTSSYVYNSFHKMRVCPMDHMEEKLTDCKAKVPPVLCLNGEGSAAPRPQNVISNTPSSTDGAQVVGIVNSGGSVEAQTKEGPAADGSSDQDEASTGPTKEGSTTAMTVSGMEGPAADGAKDQDEASTGPTKEGSTAAMTVSAPEGPAADGIKDQDDALSGPAEETTADYGSPDEGAPVKLRRSPLKRIRKFFGRVRFVYPCLRRRSNESKEGGRYMAFKSFQVLRI